MSFAQRGQEAHHQEEGRVTQPVDLAADLDLIIVLVAVQVSDEQLEAERDENREDDPQELEAGADEDVGLDQVEAQPQALVVGPATFRVQTFHK